MLIRVYLITFFTCMPSVFSSELIKGSIYKYEGQFLIQNREGVFPLLASPAIMRSIPSLESPTFVSQSDDRRYTFQFKGQWSNKSFRLDDVPTIVPGEISEEGFLDYNPITKEYSLNGRPIRFGSTKFLNGYKFDDISKQFFIGKSILAEGYYDIYNDFVVNALTPTNLFSAKKPDPSPNIIGYLIHTQKPTNFALHTMNKNRYSQATEAFRSIFYEDKKNKVQVGDHFLIITLSGRQGDTFAAFNGHMAVGIGEVKDDMSLRAEVSNLYTSNEKDILSSNTSLTHYFSHLIQGQNIYSPTYTFIAYGIDKAKLKQFRDALEKSHILFRTQKLSLSSDFNPTTETVKALNSIEIIGQYKKRDNEIMGALTRPMTLLGEVGKNLNFTLAHDTALYYPRPAFNSLARTFLDDKLRKDLQIKRVDYIFYPQIPSARPRGGAANNKKSYAVKFKSLYKRYELDSKTKLLPPKLRALLERKLQIIE